MRTSSAAIGSRPSRAPTAPIRAPPRGAVLRGRALDPHDVDLALDAAHAAREAWGETSTTDRAKVLNAIADAIEANLEMLAVAESWENGKPVRETLNADLPLAIDHFRYFAGAIRAEEGGISEIDKDTIAYHFHEPLGVVGQIIPFNFPLLMAAWKLAPAVAAGNCVVIKPASPTPWSLLKLMEVLRTSSRPASSTSSPDPARPSAWRLPRASGSRRSPSPARPSPAA
jgi:acyl-CoA reductase-like NAD-dependent aldehyde dehydrogenase